MRKEALFLAAVLLSVSVPPALAEIAVMESGKILYIDRYERADELITLFLSGGGVARIPAELVANIVPNEIVADNGAEAAELPLIPQLGDIITPAARRWGLDPRLVAAVVWVESSGDPKAISRKGAQGLMQLMPDTARNLGVEDTLDPAQNVEAGTRYLREMLDRHGRNLSLALAAYNAGPDAVVRHGGIPPYPETRRYVERVLQIYRNAGGSAEEALTS